jgi:hypothetical protein
VARTKLQPVIIVVEGGRVPISRLRKVVQNPKRIKDEDEADYEYCMAVLRQGGKPVSAESVLRKYGRRVDR